MMDLLEKKAVIRQSARQIFHQRMDQLGPELTHEERQREMQEAVDVAQRLEDRLAKSQKDPTK